MLFWAHTVCKSGIRTWKAWRKFFFTPNEGVWDGFEGVLCVFLSGLGWFLDRCWFVLVRFGWFVIGLGWFVIFLCGL